MHISICISCFPINYKGFHYYSSTSSKASHHQAPYLNYHFGYCQTFRFYYATGKSHNPLLNSAGFQTRWKNSTKFLLSEQNRFLFLVSVTRFTFYKFLSKLSEQQSQVDFRLQKSHHGRWSDFASNPGWFSYLNWTCKWKLSLLQQEYKSQYAWLRLNLWCKSFALKLGWPIAHTNMFLTPQVPDQEREECPRPKNQDAFPEQPLRTQH